MEVMYRLCRFVNSEIEQVTLGWTFGWDWGDECVSDRVEWRALGAERVGFLLQH
jgi:hypothetical protein